MGSIDGEYIISSIHGEHRWRALLESIDGEHRWSVYNIKYISRV